VIRLGLASGVERWAWIKGRKEPGKEDVESEPRRELEIEVNGGMEWRARVASRERAGEKRRAKEVEYAAEDHAN
jgi:hypothetical protein